MCPKIVQKYVERPFLLNFNEIAESFLIKKK